ncbi:MAG: phosphoribosylformylglycinamidine synthase subunit PurQ [bacterium]|nr:phosphoribosylformylglycinamidine synthase subunit PurQ [bacterium]
MRCGVIIFPGSNCDHDVYHILKHLLAQEVLFLWHGDEALRDCELVVVPGGFSFGDYLRPGALAALAPVMKAVRKHADAGGLVLGIGNGFQVLQEAGLLPGAMQHSRSLRFSCRDVHVQVEQAELPFTRDYTAGQILRMPVAYSRGNYVDSEEALDALEGAGRVVFRYVEPPPGASEHPWPPAADAAEESIGGSARAIAGISNEAGNVLGMMPHPERCAEQVLGNADGLALFAGAVGLAEEQTEVLR